MSAPAGRTFYPQARPSSAPREFTMSEKEAIVALADLLKEHSYIGVGKEHLEKKLTGMGRDPALSGEIIEGLIARRSIIETKMQRGRWSFKGIDLPLNVSEEVERTMRQEVRGMAQSAIEAEIGRLRRGREARQPKTEKKQSDKVPRDH